MSNPLPIVIDYTPAVTQSAGIGRLVRQQVNALLDLDSITPYTLLIPRSTNSAIVRQNVTTTTMPLSDLWMTRLWHRLEVPLSVEWITGKITLYHGMDYVLPPLHSQTPAIVTIHDLTFQRVPNAASPRLKNYLDKVVPRSIARANHIIADSQATKNDIMEIYAVPSDKISVVLCGVEPLFAPVLHKTDIRHRYGIGDTPYLLSVGTVQPRKNYSRIIRALHSLSTAYADVVLVIAGGKGWMEDEMYQTIETLGMQNRVKLIGFVDDADLPSLYSGALMTVVTSLYEGFGIPILESMACGTPVITSNISSLPEVAGDAALIVDPYSVDEIAYAIQHLIDHPHSADDLRHKGLQRSKLFTWANSARQLHSVYNAVLTS